VHAYLHETSENGGDQGVTTDEVDSLLDSSIGGSISISRGGGDSRGLSPGTTAFGSPFGSETPLSADGKPRSSGGRPKGKGRVDMEKVRQIVARLDSDNSGKLDKEEVKALVVSTYGVPKGVDDNDYVVEQYGGLPANVAVTKMHETETQEQVEIWWDHLFGNPAPIVEQPAEAPLGPDSSGCTGGTGGTAPKLSKEQEEQADMSVKAINSGVGGGCKDPLCPLLVQAEEWANNILWVGGHQHLGNKKLNAADIHRFVRGSQYTEFAEWLSGTGAGQLMQFDLNKDGHFTDLELIGAIHAFLHSSVEPGSSMLLPMPGSPGVETAGTIDGSDQLEGEDGGSRYRSTSAPPDGPGGAWTGPGGSDPLAPYDGTVPQPSTHMPTKHRVFQPGRKKTLKKIKLKPRNRLQTPSGVKGKGGKPQGQDGDPSVAVRAFILQNAQPIHGRIEKILRATSEHPSEEVIAELGHDMDRVLDFIAAGSRKPRVLGMIELASAFASDLRVDPDAQHLDVRFGPHWISLHQTGAAEEQALPPATQMSRDDSRGRKTPGSRLDTCSLSRSFLSSATLPPILDGAQSHMADWTEMPARSMSTGWAPYGTSGLPLGFGRITRTPEGGGPIRRRSVSTPLGIPRRKSPMLKVTVPLESRLQSPFLIPDHESAFTFGDVFLEPVLESKLSTPMLASLPQSPQLYNDGKRVYSDGVATVPAANNVWRKDKKHKKKRGVSINV